MQGGWDRHGTSPRMIQRQEPYREAGADFFDRQHPEDTARRLIKRLESLGYQVTLQNPSTEAVP